MVSVLRSLLLTLRTLARSRAALHLEILALRHQLDVLQRTRTQRVQLARTDRWLWVMLARFWAGWRAALVLVRPETVIAWHRQGFRLWWTWKSRRRLGRPTAPSDIRSLIRTMAAANPRWGAPRIHGELLKLGIDVCQATVAKYMGRRRQPPSQTRRSITAAPRPRSATHPARGRSPRIRGRPGRHSNSARPFRGTRRLDTCSTTAITRSPAWGPRRGRWELRN